MLGNPLSSPVVTYTMTPHTKTYADGLSEKTLHGIKLQLEHDRPTVGEMMGFDGYRTLDRTTYLLYYLCAPVAKNVITQEDAVVVAHWTKFGGKYSLVSQPSPEALPPGGDRRSLPPVDGARRDCVVGQAPQ